MLTLAKTIVAIVRPHLLAVVCLLLCGSWAGAQGAVAVLKTSKVGAEAGAPVSTTDAQVAFTLHRNLIFFDAAVNGQPGKFILDTGAPTLLLNHRGRAGNGIAQTGTGTGGDVTLTNQKVESFAFTGQEYGASWALALDLRGMEKRMSTRIDGYVGQEMLRNRELRIDYGKQHFQLRSSVRKPTHGGVPPRAVLPFEFVDHLPVVTMSLGGRNRRFAIDTGAGVSLLDKSVGEHEGQIVSSMNIQGLDGQATNHEVVRVSDLRCWDNQLVNVNFTLINLDQLQSSDDHRIAGILGADFLADYVVGIDYRRRRLYFW